MKYLKITLSVLILLLILSSIFPANVSFASDRISGISRYETAVEVSKRGWINGANTVILAKGTDFPDALAGGPLAFKLDAPILLTKSTSLPTSTKNEIIRLGANKVIVLGGEGAISNSVENSLKTLGISVERISGKDRYETAAKIAEKLSSQHAIVANGDNFPDALGISPYAAKNGIPILLTKKDQLPLSTEIALIGKVETKVVGGVSAVSNLVMAKLPSPTRFSGANRYETNSSIVRSLPGWGNKVYIATGMNFADALSGSVLAAKNNAPILLVSDDSIPYTIYDLLYQFTDFNVLGGENAINSDVFQEIISFEPLIKDLTLERLIRSKLGLESNDILTVEKLEELTVLDNTGLSDINNLDGLENAINLNSLVLKNTNVDDITPLSNLTKLTHIDIENNEISDLSPLLINANNFGLSQGDYVNVKENPVDLSENSQNLIVIQELVSLGITVEYGETSIPIPPSDPYTYLELNNSYTSLDNEMTVTMNNIEVVEYDGYFEYNITYTEENKTTDKVIDQGSFKIFYSDESSESQYGFFNKLYPGQSASRSYTFKSLKEKESLFVEYGADLFFNQTPSEDTLKWKLIR
ncbi:cell wall-binding repeat-containing protein [Paenisporosarcina sp. TG20]|uniref:cell wall-binding repeat-containing protein n=1 Tax=Paenisporosarcina sp. TG20 TaxID=1211706 RepID=UPI0003610188|nr:cell wall-binding repeat-containing protein [Paenisporosarcina sp. TG20]